MYRYTHLFVLYLLHKRLFFGSLPGTMHSVKVIHIGRMAGILYAGTTQWGMVDKDANTQGNYTWAHTRALLSDS